MMDTPTIAMLLVGIGFAFTISYGAYQLLNIKTI